MPTMYVKVHPSRIRRRRTVRARHWRRRVRTSMRMPLRHLRSSTPIPRSIRRRRSTIRRMPILRRIRIGRRRVMNKRRDRACEHMS